MRSPGLFRGDPYWEQGIFLSVVGLGLSVVFACGVGVLAMSVDAGVESFKGFLGGSLLCAWVVNGFFC